VMKGLIVSSGHLTIRPEVDGVAIN
jgi:hypothetical protein